MVALRGGDRVSDLEYTSKFAQSLVPSPKMRERGLV